MLEYLSVSRIKTYACPYRFQQLYLRGVREPSSEPAQLGSYTHRLIADAIAADHDLQDPAPDARDTGLVPSPDIAQQAEDLVSAWSENDVLAGMRPLAVEAECLGTLDCLMPFKGRLDLACEWKGSLVLWDWKTSWQMPQSLGNEAQLATYAWLAAGMWPELAEGPIYIRQHYVRYGRWIEAQITPAGRSNARYTLTRIAEGIEAAVAGKTGEWPACPCAQCGFCSLACPLSDVLIRAPQDAKAATNLAGRLVALEAQVKVAQGAVRLWCKDHGPVQACGREYGYRPQSSRVVRQSPQELIDLLGDDAWKWMQVKAPKGKVPAGVRVEDEVSGTRFGGRAADGNEIPE